MSRLKTLRGCAVCFYFKHCVIRQYRENDPTETYADKYIIDANILVSKIDKKSLESPYQTFQRFLFVPIGGDLPLRLFRPMAINKFIINHAVMRTKEELL